MDDARAVAADLAKEKRTMRIVVGVVLAAALIIGLVMWNNAKREQERRVCELTATMSGYDLVEAKILCD